MKYKNKINFRTDIIKTYFKRNQNINKTQLAKKMGISWKTLYILLNQYNSNKKLNFYQRNYPNNEISKEIIKYW